MKKIFKPTLLVLTGLCLLSFTLSSCKKIEPIPTPLTVTDADGNVYQTVTIGSQIWTTENLKTTTYNDGTPIPNVVDQAGWANLATPAYTLYGFDPNNKPTYGYLYNWHAVNSGKLAPAGWHIPTKDEWNTLLVYLGGDQVAGDKMKEAGNIHWAAPSSNAGNSSGFTALPGGLIDESGNFANLTSSALFWTSTETDLSNSIAYGLSKSGTNVTLSSFSPKNRGYSIRLVKD